MNDELIKRLKECEMIIYKLANKYKSFYNYDDLFQAGCLGVIKAYKKYNDSLNCKFTTYSYKYIMGEMIDFIRKDKNIIVSDEVYLIYRKYVKVKELLSNKYEREVSFDEICSFMNIERNNLLNIIESISFSKSIDDEMCTYDNRDKVIDELNLKEEIESLSKEEKSLIDYRYFKGYSQKQTAELMNTSQCSISRNEKLILSKMKTKLS